MLRPVFPKSIRGTCAAFWTPRAWCTVTDAIGPHTGNKGKSLEKVKKAGDAARFRFPPPPDAAPLTGRPRTCTLATAMKWMLPIALLAVCPVVGLADTMYSNFHGDDPFWHPLGYPETATY